MADSDPGATAPFDLVEVGARLRGTVERAEQVFAKEPTAAEIGRLRRDLVDVRMESDKLILRVEANLRQEIFEARRVQALMIKELASALREEMGKARLGGKPGSLG